MSASDLAPRKRNPIGAAMAEIARELQGVVSVSQPACRCPANNLAYEQLLAALNALVGLDSGGAAVARIEIGHARPLLVLVDKPKAGVVNGAQQTVTMYGAQVDRAMRGTFRGCDVEWDA